MFDKGETFFMPVYGKGPHLHFVISDCNEDNEVLVVNMTSTTNTMNFHQNCILQTGEHDCVDHDSFIHFYHAKSYTIEQLEMAYANGIVEPKDPCTPEILTRIQQGATTSEDFPEPLKPFFSLF